MSAANRVKAVLDSVKPLVLAQDFAKVCDRLEAETTIAENDQRLADAASLSAMLGSFRSMTGDEEAALRALRRAEELDPTNAQRPIATASHLFTRLGRTAEAKSKATETLEYPQLDSSAKHEVLALLGRIALSENRPTEAADLLGRAEDAATTSGLEAMFWDRALARELADKSAALDIVRDYLQALIDQATAESDDRTKGEAVTILERLSQQP